MKKSFSQLLLSLALLAGAVSVDAQNAHYTRYDESLAAIGQPEVIAAGHTGEGTAIAQLEANVLNWNFVNDDEVNPSYELFGGCSRPAGAKDHLGWAPEGADCKVAWVMCVKAGGRIFRECDIPVRPADYSNHATVVAKGLVSTAPGAKIVAIGMSGGGTQFSFQEAMRWLYTPGNAHQAETFDSSTTQDWLDYWAAEFGDQTPAQRFNIVAANMSNLIGYGLYSDYCEAINPAIPQTNSDGDLYLDIEDNCTTIDNEDLQDFYSPAGFYIGSWIVQRDTDGDGYGNMCDADLNNDGIADFDDMLNFLQYLGSDYPDADLNGDGIVNNVDLDHFAENLIDKPPGPSAVDLNATLDAQGLRQPGRYIQDFRYAYGFGRLDTAEDYSFSEEIAGLRAAGVAPVIAAGNITASNSVASPACTAGAVPVSGIRADFAATTPVSGSIGSTSSPNLTAIVAPAQIIDDPNDADPLPAFGSATSFATPVVAGSIAIMRAADVDPYASVEQTLVRLQTTGATAYDNRNCNPGADVLQQNPSAPPDPARDAPSIYCPAGTDPATGNVDYELPLLDLATAVDAALQDNSQCTDPGSVAVLNAGDSSAGNNSGAGLSDNCDDNSCH